VILGLSSSLATIAGELEPTSKTSSRLLVARFDVISVMSPRLSAMDLVRILVC